MDEQQKAKFVGTTTTFVCGNKHARCVRTVTFVRLGLRWSSNKKPVMFECPPQLLVWALACDLNTTQVCWNNRLRLGFCLSSNKKPSVLEQPPPLVKYVRVTFVSTAPDARQAQFCGQTRWTHTCPPATSQPQSVPNPPGTAAMRGGGGECTKAPWAREPGAKAPRARPQAACWRPG